MLRLPNKNDAKHVVRGAAYLGLACLVAVLIWSFRWTVRGPVFEVPRVVAQNVYRQQCPSLTTPVVSLYFGLADGSLIQWGCLDTVSGNLYIGNVGYVAPPNPVSGVNATAQIQSALNLLGTNAEVHIPPGITWVFNSSTIAITSPGQSIKCGTGSAATNEAIFLITDSTADVFQVTAPEFSIQGCEIAFTLSSTRASFDVFNLANTNAVQPNFENLRIQGDNSGNNYNSGNIFFGQGALASYTAGWHMKDVTISGFWNTAFQAGSSSGGTITGYFPEQIFTTPDADFAVAEIDLNSGVDTMRFEQSQLWNGTSGNSNPVILCRNTLASQAPRYITFENTTIENHNTNSTTFGPDIQLDSVRAFNFLGSPLLGHGSVAVAIGAAAIGVNISNNYVESFQHSAITSATGAVLITLNGNFFQDIGIATTATYPVVDIGAGVSRLTVVSNNFAKYINSNIPLDDVKVETGGSDYYIISGNDFGATGSDFSAATAISDGGTGTHKTITGNTST